MTMTTVTVSLCIHHATVHDCHTAEDIEWGQSVFYCSQRNKKQQQDRVHHLSDWHDMPIQEPLTVIKTKRGGNGNVSGSNGLINYS